MTDRPYTDDDLRAEAARQHQYLTRVDADDPEAVVTTISDRMTSKLIPSTVTDLEPETGEALEMGRAWGQLPGEPFQQARSAVGALLAGAADVSQWAVDLGADGLEPSPHVLNLDGDDKPVVRLHMAFHPDMDERDRQRFGLALAQVMADNL